MVTVAPGLKWASSGWSSSVKQVTGQQRFNPVTPSATIAVGLLDSGQIDLEFLAAQVLHGVIFLPGFGVDGVPVFHADCGNGRRYVVGLEHTSSNSV